MPTCKLCKNHFPNKIIFNGQPKDIHGRKYCLQCSPYGERNTRDLVKIKSDIKSSYQNNSNYIKDYYNKRKKRKLQLIVLKGGKCNRCGYDKCMDALTFHHRDPKEKSFPLSVEYIWKKKIDILLKEADKCDLLCHNCHAEHHAKEIKSIPELLQEIDISE